MKESVRGKGGDGGAGEVEESEAMSRFLHLSLFLPCRGPLSPLLQAKRKAEREEQKKQEKRSKKSDVVTIFLSCIIIFFSGGGRGLKNIHGVREEEERRKIKRRRIKEDSALHLGTQKYLRALSLSLSPPLLYFSVSHGGGARAGGG